MSRIYYSKTLVSQEEVRNLQVEVEKFLGEYRAFSTGEALVDQVNNKC